MEEVAQLACVQPSPRGRTKRLQPQLAPRKAATNAAPPRVMMR